MSSKVLTKNPLLVEKACVGKNCGSEGCTPGKNCEDYVGCIPGVDGCPGKKQVDDEFFQLSSLDADPQPTNVLNQTDGFHALSVDASDSLTSSYYDDLSTFQSFLF